MTTKIFVNLPVKDLNKTIEFFTKLGFKFNPQFTDENATCMIVGEDIFVMLLIENFFKTFTKKQISDTSKNTEVIVALYKVVSMFIYLVRCKVEDALRNFQELLIRMAFLKTTLKLLFFSFRDQDNNFS